MRTVTLYTRKGCHLCDLARELLERARRRAAFQLDIIDIDTDARLRARYDQEVPVIAIDGRDLFRYSVDLDAFLERLGQPS